MFFREKSKYKIPNILRHKDVYRESKRYKYRIDFYFNNGDKYFKTIKTDKKFDKITIDLILDKDEKFFFPSDKYSLSYNINSLTKYKWKYIGEEKYLYKHIINHYECLRCGYKNNYNFNHYCLGKYFFQYECKLIEEP